MITREIPSLELDIDLQPMNLSPAIQFSVDHARKSIEGKKILTITGAGISTDSGIPDYRGEGHVEKHPMTFETFTGSHSSRARYWARSYVGWQRIIAAMPNTAHELIAKTNSPVITQNVDGLHQQAGSTEVLELHGTLSRVVCMGCGSIISREEMDRRLHDLNPNAVRDLDVEISPDGDAEIEVTDDFSVPDCGHCGGFYKPDVVFFGESVPQSRARKADQLVEQSEGLLVLGSSLSVNSGLRLVKAALKQQKPVVIVNRGQTKADGMVTAKINASITEVLPGLIDA